MLANKGAKVMKVNACMQLYCNGSPSSKNAEQCYCELYYCLDCGYQVD